MEAYRTNRKVLAKLRCSSHSLIILVTRHHKMDVDSSKYDLCNKVEDEIRFITEC